MIIKGMWVFAAAIFRVTEVLLFGGLCDIQDCNVIRFRSSCTNTLGSSQAQPQLGIMPNRNPSSGQVKLGCTKLYNCSSLLLRYSRFSKLCCSSGSAIFRIAKLMWSGNLCDRAEQVMLGVFYPKLGSVA